jgi:Glycosyl transferase family 11
MIIAASQEGQLCNRLFHFSHLISHAVNSGNRLWYPFFKEYAHYFPNLNRKSLDDLQISIYSNQLIRSILPRLTSFLSKCHQDLSFLAYIKADREIIDLSSIPQKIIRNNLLALDGWLFRDTNYFLDNASLIRGLFQFTSTLEDAVIKLVEEIKKKSGTYLVGVHIRRGDYAQWENGRYYFDDEAYLSFINQTSLLLSKHGRKVIFIICSNEQIASTSPLHNASNITVHQKTAIEDLCLMSKCDFLIGPPSSFTSWASFMGEVPLLHIESLTQKFTAEQFKISAG